MSGSKKNSIKVFEHSKLKVDGKSFTQRHFDALSRFWERQEIEYFKLGNKCIHFKNYVGVIQVNGLCIEILPKMDRGEKNGEKKEACQRHLIQMLQESGMLKVSAPSRANLKWRNNTLLDLYIKLFIEQVNMLIKQGLIKKYRKQEQNIHTLKGKLMFGKNIKKNLIHKERFYCKYSVYNKNHLLHSVLYQCLQFLSSYAGAVNYRAETNRLLFNFPLCEHVNITKSTFEKLVWDRKTTSYKEAVQSVQMLLLNYHPDIKSGTKDVLAILFDMNRLFESWVLSRLRKNSSKDMAIYGQKSTGFWQSEQSRNRSIKPDIIMKNDKRKIILDTKWKTLGNWEPDINDLHQMHSYSSLFKSEQVYLVYPGDETKIQKEGQFADEWKANCGVISIQLVKERKLNSEFTGNLLEVLWQQNFS